MKSPQKQIIKTTIRMHQEQVKIPPNQIQHISKKKQRTTQCLMQDSSMENMKKQIQKSEELLPSQKVMVKW